MKQEQIVVARQDPALTTLALLLADEQLLGKG